MPLPILAAMAVGAGLYSLYKKGTSDEPKKTSPRLKRKLDVKTKTQLNFEISLISAAAHADGVIEQSEDEFIKERISEFKEECANDEEFYKSLSNKLDNPPSIKDLSEILNVLKTCLKY